MPEPVDNPGVLDFQDAVYGPISYDIASLCRDALFLGKNIKSSIGRFVTGIKQEKQDYPFLQISGAFWKRC